MKYDHDNSNEPRIISKLINGVTVENIEKGLKSTNFKDFYDACNIIRYAEGGKTDYVTLKSMRDLANKMVREHLGDLDKLYDAIVKRSKQELWGGDELYALFESTNVPTYVAKCIMSMLYVNEYMQKGIKTVDDCIAVADYIYHPPISIYKLSITGDPYEFGDKAEKERKAWHKIAEFIFNGDFHSAYELIESEREY